MGYDIFLMGTAGSYNDPNRALWREPIKAACAKIGVTCYDPVVPTWDESAAQREADALANCRILIMAVTAHTSGVGSLAESGWMVASAMMRKQTVGIWIDPSFEGTKVTQATMMVRREMLKQMAAADTLEDSSRRARKLVLSHARKLVEQFPALELYVAKDLQDLTDWTVRTAQELKKPKKKRGIFSS
jgi:hypothetical protein